MDRLAELVFLAALLGTVATVIVEAALMSLRK